MILKAKADYELKLQLTAFFSSALSKPKIYSQ